MENLSLEPDGSSSDGSRDLMTAGGPGRIILVNGTSSSGKTTLVRTLQASLPDLWLEMGIDHFAYSLPGRAAGELVWPKLFRYVPIDDRSDERFTIQTTPLGRRFISALHAKVAGMTGLGFNVIVDQVILERSWLEEAARVWAPFVVLFVGVRCPLDVVVKRELERRDRTLGQAHAQFMSSTSGPRTTSRSTLRGWIRSRLPPVSVERSRPEWPGQEPRWRGELLSPGWAPTREVDVRGLGRRTTYLVANGDLEQFRSG